MGGYVFSSQNDCSFNERRLNEHELNYRSCYVASLLYLFCRTLLWFSYFYFTDEETEAKMDFTLGYLMK